MSAKAKEAEIKAKARALLEARANVNLGDPLPAPSAQPARKGPALVPVDEPNPDMQAWQEAVEQVRRAKEVLHRPASDYVEYPFRSMASIAGGTPPGRVHLVVMGSNVGKTTFAGSFIEAANDMDQSCHLLSAEATPEEARKAQAARRIGVNPGDIATGEFLKWPNAAEIADELARALDASHSYDDGAHRKLRISETHGYLTPEKVRTAAREAADLNATWLLIDHVDHVEGTGGLSEYQVSNAVMSAIWRSALDFDLRVICFSQLNQEVFKQNPLGVCVPPQESWVKYGGKKKELVWVMWGGYRPLRAFADEDERKKEKEAFKNGERKLVDMTEPNVLRLRLMKHRDYGERVGAVCSLEMKDGRLRDDPMPSLHGIRTQRGF